MIVVLDSNKICVPLLPSIYDFLIYIRDTYSVTEYEPYINGLCLNEYSWKSVNEDSRIKMKKSAYMRKVCPERLFKFTGMPFRIEVIKLYINRIDPFTIMGGDTIMHKLYIEGMHEEINFLLKYYPHAAFWTNTEAKTYKQIL